MTSARVMAVLAAAALVSMGASAAVAGGDPEPSRCAVPAALLQSADPLPRVTAKLRRGESVTIVAIGSSSTFGTGASSSRATYPSRLQGDLHRMFPNARVAVLNRGVPGDTASSMLRRFRKDAIDPHPDLIIWQTGTNSALGGGDIERFARDVRAGIALAREAGIEIMLMGPQYAPRFESVTNRMSFVEKLKAIAAAEHVPMFPRYEVMKHWVKSGQFSVKTMINPDGLHLTDLSYDCVGTLVAEMIAHGEVATATARAHR